MSSDTNPAAIPVLATGRKDAVGQLVHDLLLPEVDMVHFTLADAIGQELPLLLQGQVPEAKSCSVGSGHWDLGPPVALLFGGAYSDADLQQLRGSLGLDAPGNSLRRIPWLRVDSTKSQAKPGPSPEYAAEVARRFKEGLHKLQAEGKLGTQDDGIYLV